MRSPEPEPADVPKPSVVAPLADDASTLKMVAPTSPLWRRPAVVRLLLIALFAETGYAVLNISAMPVYLKFDRNFGESIISLVLVAFLFSEAVFKSPMGHLADRLGRKRLIVIGPALSLFTSIATLIVPYSTGSLETWAFVGLRVLDGIGAAMLWPAAFALVGDSVPDGERQQAMSMLNMCYLIGVGIALPLGGAANELIGPYLASFTGARSPSFFLSAALFATVAIIAYVKLPSEREERAKVHAAKVASGETGLQDFLRSVRRIPQFLILAVVVFAGIGFPMAIVKLFAEQQFKMGEAAFGVLVLPGAAAMAFLSVPMSRLGERLGRSRAVHLGLGLCMGGMTLISLGALIPLFRAPWIIAAGGIPVGLGFLLAIPAWFTSVSDIDPSRRAVNIGAVMTAQGLGAIIGAPIGGLLYERMQTVGLGADFGRYTPFIGCALCLALGWLLSLKILPGERPIDETSPA